MNLLALDLSGGVAAAGLRTAGVRLHAEGRENAPHSTALIPMLERLLARGRLRWHDLDLFALVVGPGSFTGLRIAAATIAGLNSALGLPVVPLSALAVTALQTDSDQDVRVCEDARAGCCYFGCYRGLHALEADACLPWHAVAARDPARYAARSAPPVSLPGWQRIPLRLPRGVAMLRAAEMLWAERRDGAALPRYPAPVYLQPSQAERNARGS